MVAVSVIIPVYNGAKTIGDTLESVLGQNFEDYEVIVINDGSTDGTEKILKEYMISSPKIKIVNQNNSGVSVARNKGIENSSGEYLCFLDADDFYKKNFLRLMMNKIKQENMELCYCGYNIYPKSKRNELMKIFNRFTKKNVLLNYINGKIPAHTSTWLIKRKLIIENNVFFRENVSWGEDREFFYILLSSTDKITYVPKYLTYYRNDVVEGRLSSFSLDKIDKDYEFIKRIVNNLKINRSDDIENALLQYQLPALITNNLLKAIEENYSGSEISYYYRKYNDHLLGNNYVNGLRSIKVNLAKKKLKNIFDKC